MSFQVVHTLTESQVNDLDEMYQQEWFSAGRKLADIKTMLDNTDLIIGLCDRETSKLFAFSRVITDTVYKAFIFDVIVSEPYRGKGFGIKIVEILLAHPMIKDIPHVELYCPEGLAAFYSQFGFEKRESILLRRATGLTVSS